MINIAKKQLPQPAIAALVYISFCASEWFSARGDLAYIGYQYSLGGAIVNDAWAFFIGGLIAFLIYELILSFSFRTLVFKTGGDVRSLRYGINYAVIAANVLLFGLKFIYLAAPLSASLLEKILDPTVTVLCVGLYMLYAFYAGYVDRSRYATALTTVMSAFIAVYGVLAVIGMIVSVSR